MAETGAAEGSLWIGYVGLAVLVAIFVAFGIAIWRSADPSRWAPPCDMCARRGSHYRACPLRARPPRPDGESAGQRVGSALLTGLIELLLGGDD